MMKKTKTRMVLCCALIAANVCLIWGNSLLNGDTSGDLSGGLSAWIGKIIPFLSPQSPYGHFLLRKCAHFSVFFLLGTELTWLFGMMRKNRVFLYALSVSAVVAAIDETIQRFIPGRHGCLSDVLIDCSGALTGMLILFLGYTLLQRKKHKQERAL